MVNNWHEYFQYKDDVLYWLSERPRRHFNSDHGWKTWHTQCAGKRAGSRGDGYSLVRVTGLDGVSRSFGAHRIIWEMHNGPAPSGMMVDHINRNTGDSRLQNLRLSTNSQNLSNRPKPANNKSGYKGVSWNKRAGKWVAYINANGRRTNLGYFNCPTSAAVAYDAAAREIHGEFAMLNLS